MGVSIIEPSGWEYAGVTSTTIPTPTPTSQSQSQSSTPNRTFGDWTKCVHFPTEIHWELLEAGKIPDWNLKRHEHDVQWVSKRTWAFRSTLEIGDAVPGGKGKKVEIEFESLDTFATVYLVSSPAHSMGRLMR